MPTPSTWQTTSVALKRAGDPQTLSRVAGLEFMSRCVTGSWPTLAVRGGVQGYGSTMVPTNSAGAPTIDSTTETILGTISVPGHSVPSISETSDWSHNSVAYSGEFTLTHSRLPPGAALIETTQTTIRACAGNVRHLTTNGTTITDAGSSISLPKYVVWHTSGGYQVAALSATPTDLSGMDQPWILIYWGSNSHWCESTLPMSYSQENGQGWGCFPQRYAWRADAPLLLTFGVNPTSIVQTAGVGGFDLGFGASPVAFSILSLYGRIRPHADVTDLWVNSAAIPTGLKTFIGTWYPRCQQFPRSAAETYAWTSDTATITNTVTWTTVLATGSPVKFCPIQPMVGVADDTALTLGYSGSVVDGGIPSEYGPSLGIVGVDSYSYTLSGLATYTAPRAAPGAGPIPSSVSTRLNAEVDAFIAHTHWQPWIVSWTQPQYNFASGAHWANPADTLTQASELLALTSGSRHTALKNWLDTERAAFPPETVYKDVGSGGGTTARGPFAIPTAAGVIYLDTFQGLTAPLSPFDGRVSLWSCWGLARYYQATGTVPAASVVTALVALLDTDMLEMDWASGSWFSNHGETESASWNVNRAWAGLCGLAWLCANAVGGPDANEPLVRALLAKFTATRIGMSHMPRWQASVGLITLPTDLGSSSANHAWLPSFQGLANAWEGQIFQYTWATSADDPRDVVHCNQFALLLDDSTHRREVYGGNPTVHRPPHAASAYSFVAPMADLLLAALGTEATARVAKIPELNPHWYLPFVEPILGQEIGLQPAADSYGTFLERAWLQATAATTLEREAGYSWLNSGGDLFYLHKLAETARAYAGTIPSGPYATNIVDTGTVAKRSLFHVTFDVLQSVATNTFLPYDASPPAGQSGTVGITVDAEFSDDSYATTIIRPGTYEQLFDHQIKGGHDWLYPLGFSWNARFSPPRAGSWQYRIRTTDAGGTNVSAATPFTVTAASVPGRIKPATSDTRYFETEDGNHRPLVGFNMKNASLSFNDPTVAAATIAALGAAGVNYIRLNSTDWGVWGSESRLWETTQSGDQYAYISAALSSPSLTPYPSFELARYVATGYSSTFVGHNRGGPPVKRSTTYHVEVTAQIPVTLTGPVQAGQPFGFALKTSDLAHYIFNYATEPEEYNKGTLVSTPVAGIHGLLSGGMGTTDGGSLLAGGMGQHAAWQTITGTITTGASQDFLDYFIWTDHNCTGSAAAYVHSAKIREDLGGGNYGPNILTQEHMDRFVDTDQRAEAQFDLILQAAEAAGVAIQVVVLGAKQEPALELMADDGTISVNLGEDDFHGGTGSRARWIHKAVARRFMGRYGYSSAIFGIEYVNEQSYSARAFAAAQELGLYIKSLGDAPMVGTSTSNDFQKPSWDGFTAADWVDFHLYRQNAAGVGDSLRVDATTVPETITVGAGATDFHDTASLTSKISLLVGAKTTHGQNRPTIQGETGLIASSNTDNPTTELDADSAGIWWHKFLWAQCNSGGVVSSYWYVPEHLYDPVDGVPNHLAQTAYYTTWIKQFPLNNGHYADAAPTLSDSTHLRVFGQRDLTNNRLHLWIDNKGHTWKTVVDGTPVTPGTGTISIDGLAAGPYTVVWKNTYDGTTVKTETVVASSPLILTLPASLSTDIAVSAAPAGGPIVPTDEVILSGGRGSPTGQPLSDGLGGTLTVAPVPGGSDSTLTAEELFLLFRRRVHPRGWRSHTR